MPWLSILEVRRLPTGSRRLTRALHYRDPYGRIWRVPRGFETDFSSIPWFARSFVPRWSVLDRPGALHDYFYRTGKGERMKEDSDHYRRVSIYRKDADLLWKEGALDALEELWEHEPPRWGGRTLRRLQVHAATRALRLGARFAYQGPKALAA